jgi:hypothetical protein
MPLLDLLSKNRVDESVLLHNRQALELLRDNIQRVHGATASTDVLDLVRLLAIILFLNGLRHRCSSYTSNLSGFRPSFSMLKTLSSPSSRKSGGSTVLVRASELYALVDAMIEVFFTDWKEACHGVEAAILEVANVLENPSVKAREARIIILGETAIVVCK